MGEPRCQQCGGTGTKHDLADVCPKCRGRGKQRCPIGCHGFGRCSYCNDTSYTDDTCRECKGERFIKPGTPCPAAHVVLRIDGADVWCDPEKLVRWCATHGNQAGGLGCMADVIAPRQGDVPCVFGWAVVPTVYEEAPS